MIGHTNKQINRDYIDANLIRAKNLINEGNAKLASYL